MATKTRMMFLLAAATALTWGVPGFASDQKVQVDAKALFEAKCSACHPSDRPKAKKKTREEWDKTVTRMIKANGASITDGEAKTIIDYLAAHHGS